MPPKRALETTTTRSVSPPSKKATKASTIETTETTVAVKKTTTKTVEEKTTQGSPKKRIKSTTTKSAVASFFTATSKKPPVEKSPTSWNVVEETLLVGKYTRAGEEGNRGERRKIAGFDLDGTLIATQSGNKFAKNDADWKWWRECVPSKLKELHEEGYQIIIFTNQGGIKAPKKNHANLPKFKSKVAAVLNALDIPLTVYAATEKDRFRKPRTGMWQEMIDDYNLDVHGVDLENSYLVGDAAGRKGDFADSDRHWALNVGIKFHTPEEFFLGEAAQEMSHRFDPENYIADKESGGDKLLFAPKAEKELVMFVGPPAAGKSTFFRKNLEPLGYERVNQDTLKTKEKCVKVARELLSQGKNVVIDNTNPEASTRLIWVTLAKEYGYKLRCLYFNSPIELCHHNDAVRAFGGDTFNPDKRTLLPGIAFNTFTGRFAKPSKDEGFDVEEITFEFNGTEEERKIWSKYWT
ncbi:Similar to Bifunctional polynucleotide phosphatase/kinase; acc. no. O13911 [Pyronema omphalodes CBS 100304]|uniref:Similar to Bifunctional polynucleotide phosphatase/kinase acc. no. O13911 n=1 Tax=Pyronema omphalodes (strain CBS 100304) TaxID=1076935 RepID=U4KWQ4_PYROM|nr:Similar to Bifunctional polynucleotide phosphatase/kinase; acc. no. O13911 [Pyronema omphalodes CBS 100304]